MQQNALKHKSTQDYKVEHIANNIDSIYDNLTGFYKYSKDDELVKIMNRECSKSSIFTTVKVIRNKNALQTLLAYRNFGDLMISFNTFETKDSAAIKNLNSLNAFCIDIDYKTIPKFKNMDAQKFAFGFGNDEFDRSVPWPTYVEFSNQIRLIYCLQYPIKNVGKNKKILTTINRISQVYSEKLKEYGAERQPLSSFVRIPHSMNTKNDSEVKYMFGSGKYYELNELFKFMPDTADWYDEWKAKQYVKNAQNAHTGIKKVQAINGRVSMLKSRINDLETLQSYFNNNGKGGKGHREILCYLYRNFAMQLYDDDKMAKAEMLKFNEKFECPHAEYNLSSKTYSVSKKINGYKYKDKALRELFGEQLCDELGVFGGMSNAERQKLHKARKKVERLKNGETKAQQIENVKLAIIELRVQGKKNREIIECLKIPQTTLERHIKALKTEGRL